MFPARKEGIFKYYLYCDMTECFNKRSHPLRSNRLFDGVRACVLCHCLRMSSLVELYKLPALKGLKHLEIKHHHGPELLTSSVIPCSLVGIHIHFRGAYCLNLSSRRIN
jgi:hypothetical protein